MILRSTKSTMKTLKKTCPSSFFSFLFTLPWFPSGFYFCLWGGQFFCPTLGWTSLQEILAACSLKRINTILAPGRSTPFWRDVQSPLDVVEDLEVPRVSDTPKALITSQAVVSHSPATWFFSRIFFKGYNSPFIRVKKKNRLPMYKAIQKGL